MRKKKALMFASVASMVDLFNRDNIANLEELGYEVTIACNFSEGSVYSKMQAEEFMAELKKKGYKEDAYTGLKELSDVIGIRIVTHFVGDIYLILENIKKHENWKVIKEKDYIARPKENGYRSFHVIFSVPFDGGDLDTVNIELQLRTIAMDCWAALEHQMRYKKDVKNTALIANELKRCSDEMASTDLTMQTIRDVLMMK